MKEYKQWHDENNTFFSEFKIMFGQCNLKHELSLTEILRILSDTAVEDYAQRGMTWQFLDEREVAILLSRASTFLYTLSGIFSKLSSSIKLN